MNKSADAFRTISEVAEELGLPQHVLRFWETRFPQIKPLKRAGGRRYYRPRDIEILRAIQHLLYHEGYTIRGVQRVLKEHIAGAVAATADGADAGGTGFPVSMEPEGPSLQGAGISENEAIGHHPRMVHSGGPSPTETHAHADRQDAAGTTSERAAWALALSVEDVERLRTALAELAECENILDAARRR